MEQTPFTHPILPEQQQLWQEHKKRCDEERQTRFKNLGGLSVLYALFSTICMHRNFTGITMPLVLGILKLFY